MALAVELVAHRGHAALYPENTLEALESAVAAGARWVEIDVQLCAGGVPVLLHDANLQRVAGRPESVFELTPEALAAIPVGEPERFGGRFPAARAPTLAQFVAWLEGHPGVSAFVEMKLESIERFGRSAVLEACCRVLEPVAGRWAPVSFDRDILAEARVAGLNDVGWVVRGFDPVIDAAGRSLPARWLFCNKRYLPPGPLPAGPWDWVVYEVPDAETAKALAVRGARWLETHAVGAVRAALHGEVVPAA
jgi:glycerophosphoryl diester phosphodiesterase